MIPYQDVTLRDFVRYWGDSPLLRRCPKSGKWSPVLYEGAYKDGDALNRGVQESTLENLTTYGAVLRWKVVGSKPLELIDCSPTEPFDSPDWVTYLPEVGYVMIRGKLYFVSCPARRQMTKGFAMGRLAVRSPLREEYWLKKNEEKQRVNDYFIEAEPSILSVAVAFCARLNEDSKHVIQSWVPLVEECLRTGKPKAITGAVALLPIAPDAALVCVKRALMGTVRLSKVGTVTLKEADIAEHVPASYLSWVRKKLVGPLTGKEKKA